MLPSDWVLNQANTIAFVLIDSNGTEVAGLGDTFDLLISKNGDSFVSGTGDKSEVGLGWYRYASPSDEADTEGEVKIVASGTGTIQQNLVYTVASDPSGAVVASLMAYVIASGKTVQQAWLDIWAVTVGNAVSNNANNPTSIAYKLPDGSTIQVTHILTPTTRVID